MPEVVKFLTAGVYHEGQEFPLILRTHFIVALGALALGADLAIVSAQGQPATLQTWRAAVEAHVPGQLDSSIKTVSSWTKSELEDVLQAFEKTTPASGADRAARDARAAWLLRAILLHTDVLVLLRQPVGYALPPSSDRSVGLVADGVQLGVQRGTVQWEFARRLVDVLHGQTAAGAVSDAPRLWYRATTAFLQSWLDWSESGTHLAQGRKLFPDDAVLLLYEGTIHEAFAGPAIQTLEPPKDLMTPEPVRFATGSVFSLMNLQRPTSAVSWIFQSADVETQEAERLLRQAIDLDPRMAEARVRLGHVLGLRGRHAEAVDALERGVALATSPIVRYWGLVWLGRERRDAGRSAAATEAFEQAAALYPHAPTPRLGLSQLLYDRGDRARALDEYAATLTAETKTDDDPRLAYEHTHAPSAEALLAELRAAFGS